MWLEFIANGTRINDLLGAWRAKLAGHSTNTPMRVIDLLAANPSLTITGAARQLELAFTTAQRAIGRLEQYGVVQQVSDAKRDRSYCARATNPLLDVMTKEHYCPLLARVALVTEPRQMRAPLSTAQNGCADHEPNPLSEAHIYSRHRNAGERLQQGKVCLIRAGL